VRTGVRQPGPADHGRRQFGAVADQGGCRLGGGRGAQAQAAVQSDVTAQDQAARRWTPRRSQIPRGRRAGRAQSTVAGAQVAGQGNAAVAGVRPAAAAQRAASKLLATGGDGREEQEQLGAEPGRHAGVGRAQAGQPDERQAQGAAQTAAEAQNEGRPVVRGRRRGRYRSLRPAPSRAPRERILCTSMMII